MSSVNFGLYHAQSKSAALQRKADAALARADALRNKAEVAERAAQALHDQAERVLVDYLTQPQLPEFEKAKAALDSGTPLDQVIKDLDAFYEKHLKPLDYRFFERRDDASRAPVMARISEINDWCSEQERRLDQEASPEGPLTPEEIRRMNGESA